MERKFGYYIFQGLVIGFIFEMAMGAANGNPLFGIGLGVLSGGTRLCISNVLGFV